MHIVTRAADPPIQLRRAKVRSPEATAGAPARRLWDRGLDRYPDKAARYWYRRDEERHAKKVAEELAAIEVRAA
jgi:hypothetical protein